MSILFRERRSSPSAQDILSAATRFRGEDQSGGYIYSTTEAMQIAAVVACVGLRSGAFAQIPLKGYRLRDGQHELLPSQPSLLVRPSPTVVPSVWKTQMSISRDIWGFAVGRILGVDAAGYPSMAEWLPPSEARAWQDHMSGPLRWKIGNEEVDASLLLHVPSRWVMPGNPLGMSPLERSGLVDLAKRAQDFGRDWFRNGAVPSSIIYSEQELTGKQADDIVATVMSKWRARKPALLDSRLKYEQVSVGANESQFLETQRQVAADIAVSFNLPPEKINAVVSGQSVTYANREQNVQQYLMDSINPDLVVIQEVFEQFLPRGQFPRWATGAFLRSDLKTRYESYKVGLEAGFLAVDEVRAWEEMKPMEVAPVPAPVVDEEPRAVVDVAAEVRAALAVHEPVERKMGDTHFHLPESIELQLRQEPIVIPAPVVNVPAAQVTVNVEPTPVTVNVEPTPVSVNPAITVSAPDVNVTIEAEPSDDGDESITIVRDGQGRIVGAKKVKG